MTGCHLKWEGTGLLWSHSRTLLTFQNSSFPPLASTSCYFLLFPFTNKTAPLLWAQWDTLSSQNKSPSANSTCFVTTTQSLILYGIREKPDPRYSKPELQVPPPSHTFLDCRISWAQGIDGYLGLLPSLHPGPGSWFLTAVCKPRGLQRRKFCILGITKALLAQRMCYIIINSTYIWVPPVGVC